jgi:pilus assembly protein CpaB
MAKESAAKTWLLLLGAIGFGVAAAVLSVIYLNTREAAILAQLGVEKEETAAVVVANQNLRKGLQIDPGYFAIREIPATYVHPDAITPATFDQLVGKVLVQDLAEGRPLLQSFIDKEFPVDFSDTIPLGRRAMTITVDEISSQSNLTRPGNRIDIYVNIPAEVTGFQPGGAAQPVALAAGQAQPQVRDVVMPVLQDVLVLATGREGYDDFQEQLLRGQTSAAAAGIYTTMTLDVAPEQAAMLVAAQDKGDLVALLRNRKDRGGATFTGITTADLLEHSRNMQKAALMQSAQRSLDGVTQTPDGKLVTKDGVVIQDPNLTIGPDGTIITKSGISLAGKGLSINEKGELVAPDGTVVKAEDIIVTQDGVVMTKDGKILSPPADARITKDGFIITADGKVMTKDGVVLEGVTVTEDGSVVAADGTVLKPDEITLNPDGTISSRGKTYTDFVRNEDGSVTLADGTVLKPGEFATNPDGSITVKGTNYSDYTANADGSVTLADGTVLKSGEYIHNPDGTITAKVRTYTDFKTNPDGSITLADGRVLKPDEFVRNPDGSISTKPKAIAGVSGTRDLARASTLQAALGITPEVEAAVAPVPPLQFIGYIRGGESEAGVAKPGVLPVLPVKQDRIDLETLIEQLKLQGVPPAAPAQ